MTNYLPATVPGTSRKRAKAAVLQNTYGTIPSIRWSEEDQIMMADGEFKYVDAGAMITTVTPEVLSDDFPLIDPDTGTVLGTANGMQLMLMLQSFYINQANQRDNPPAEPEPESPPEEQLTEE